MTVIQETLANYNDRPNQFVSTRQRIVLNTGIFFELINIEDER